MQARWVPNQGIQPEVISTNQSIGRSSSFIKGFFGMNVLCWIKALFAAGQLFHTANFRANLKFFPKPPKTTTRVNKKIHSGQQQKTKKPRVNTKPPKEKKNSQIIWIANNWDWQKYNFKSFWEVISLPVFLLNNFCPFQAVRIMQFHCCIVSKCCTVSKC